MNCKLCEEECDRVNIKWSRKNKHYTRRDYRLCFDCVEKYFDRYDCDIEYGQFTFCVDDKETQCIEECREFCGAEHYYVVNGGPWADGWKGPFDNVDVMIKVMRDMERVVAPLYTPSEKWKKQEWNRLNNKRARLEGKLNVTNLMDAELDHIKVYY